MKTKLLKKLRARYAIVDEPTGGLKLLDRKYKEVVYPFVDWTIRPKRAYLNFALKTILGVKKYEQMRLKHKTRRIAAFRLEQFNQLMKLSGS